MSAFYGLHNFINSGVAIQYSKTNYCLVCNVSYPLQSSAGSNEFGSFYLQHFGKILNMPVGSIAEGDLNVEPQPFCPDCRNKLGECFRLLQELERVAFELDKLRDDIGKTVVESFSRTSYLRINYLVKQKIFQQYYHKFRDDASALSENTASTSDFSDLLTTSTVPECYSSFQNASQPEGQDITKSKRKRTNSSKAKKQSKITTENKSDAASQGKKPNGSSKRKSRLKNQNNIEEMTYDFEPHCDGISSGGDDHFSDGTGDNTSSKVQTKKDQLLKQHDDPYVKKTKYQCRFCGKYCSKSNHLVIHERMHTDERPFPCSICGKAFREKGHLLRHEKTHDSSRLLGEKIHLCPECGKAFVLADSLYNHRREKHMGKPQKRNIVSQMCETCGKVLHSLKSLKKHVMIVHEKQKPHTCSVCDKKFSYLCNKKLHIERHHKIKCPEVPCSTLDAQQIYESRELFENHFKAEHPDKILPSADEPRKGPKKSKATFNCDQCHRVFKLNKWLEEHVHKVHSARKKPVTRRKVSDKQKKTNRKLGNSTTITGTTKSRKGKSAIKKSEIKTESESEGDFDEDEKKFDTLLDTEPKRSTRLATKRRQQRTISESEADVTESEEDSDEDDEIENSKADDFLDDTVEIKQEPMEFESVDS